MEKTINVVDYKINQFGKVVEEKDIVNNPAEFAKVFAEGSVALEDLLLYLWANNIKTRACCTGHILKPMFAKKILWFEKNITEKEYLRNIHKKTYRRYLVNHPGYLSFYYTSDNMMAAAHLLRDYLNELCPDIKSHIAFSYDEISIYLDEVLYPKDVDRFFTTVKNIMPQWLSNT